MIVRNFQRTHSTFPFSSETAASLSSLARSGDQCIHHQLYGQFDLEIVCCDGQSGAHQAVLGQASKMVKEILIGDTWLLDNGEMLNVVNNNKTMRTMFLPDIKKSTVKHLLSVLYTGDVVMNSLEEASEMKALWRLLKIDLIHIKDLQIVFEADSCNSMLDPCINKSSGNPKLTENSKKRFSRGRRTRRIIHKNKRMLKNRKQNKPLSKKLLKLFEAIFAQAQSQKGAMSEKGSATVVNVEDAQNQSMEDVQPRATIIQPTDTILTEGTLSYEDQNFSYNIDLIPPDNNYPTQNTTFEPQGAIYQDQYMSFPQEDQTTQNIFIPFSFPDPVSRAPEQLSTISLSSLLPIPKDQLVNVSPKYEAEPIPDLSYNTDGFYLQPNNQHLECPDILHSMTNSCNAEKSTNVGHKTEELNSLKTFKKIPKKMPRFRENNNWMRKKVVDKAPPEDRTQKYYDYKSNKKISLIDRNFCKKKNMIRDYINPTKINIMETSKLTDIHRKNIGETKTKLDSGKEMIQGEKSYHNTKCQQILNKSNKSNQGSQPLKLLDTEEHGGKGGIRKTNSTSKCSKSKAAYVEESKYEMDEKLIESYFKSQSKLTVANKWTLNDETNLHDKSKDKFFRRQNKIRTSLVDLPNVLESLECKLFFPEEAKYSTRKKKDRLSKLQPISSTTAWQAVMPVSLQYGELVSLNTEPSVASKAENMLTKKVTKQILTKPEKQIFKKCTKQAAFQDTNQMSIQDANNSCRKSKRTVSKNATKISLQAGTGVKTEDVKILPKEVMNPVTMNCQSKVKVVNIILDGIISNVIHRNNTCQ